MTHDRFLSLLREMQQYDFSVSQPELGSLFQNPRASQLPLHLDQQWLAEQHGVDLVFPSTSGTTPLNVAALMTFANPGDTVLVQRDSHISIYSAVIHAGLNIDYVVPQYSEELGVSVGVTPAQLQCALQRNPQIKVVFLTYPNYFGIASDLTACAEVVRQHGAVLLVDAAHGAYFRHHERLPMAAEDSGATIVTQSNHKTCAALSQGSLALIRENVAGLRVIDRFYEVINQSGLITTSFNYIILASIMFSERELVEKGQEQLGCAISHCEELRNNINHIDGLSCFGFDEPQPGFFAFDPLRITVNVSKLGRSGFAVADELIKTYGIYPEMETLHQVLFLFNQYDTPTTPLELLKALQTISRNHRSERIPKLAPPALPQQVRCPRQVFYAPPHKVRVLPTHEAVGRISAETVAAYPPGSAIIVAGEVITEEVITFLQQTAYAGGVLKGASDPTFTTVKVVNE